MAQQVDPSRAAALAKVFGEIKDWLAANGAGPVVEGLRDPLTATEREALLEDREVKPSGLVLVLYELTGGQDEVNPGTFFPGVIPLLSLEFAIECWDDQLGHLLAEDEGNVPAGIEGEEENSKDWWPLAWFEDDLLVVSQASGKVYWFCETDAELAGEDLVDFFSTYRDLLRSGKYEVTVDDGEPYVRIQGPLPGSQRE